MGGEKGLRALAEAWHSRVMADEVVSHAFSHGVDPHHTQRLAAYRTEVLGGPAVFSRTYGDETWVGRLQRGNGRHAGMDRTAIACFDQALAQVGIAPDDGAGRVLHDYFAWATATSMAGYPDSPDDVPGGLGIARWSWDGLQQ